MGFKQKRGYLRFLSQWKSLSRKSNRFYRIIVSNDFVPIEYPVIIPTFGIQSISEKSSAQGIIWRFIIFQVFGIFDKARKCTIYRVIETYGHLRYRTALDMVVFDKFRWPTILGKSLQISFGEMDSLMSPMASFLCTLVAFLIPCHGSLLPINETKM